MSVTESLTRWMPGIGVVRSYRREWLRSDVTAGLVLAAILVPQGMAYAELAGLPGVTGLYTTIACLIGYAVFGPSRVLVLGPDSSISPLIFAAIFPLMAAGDSPATRSARGHARVFVGLVEIGLGLGKLGFAADLLSSEVQVGYMNGLGITIIVGQLPKLFGFSIDADGFIDELDEFVSNIDKTNATTLAVGVTVLVVLLVLPRVLPRIPAILVAVVGVTIVSAVLDLAADGVATVGSLPRGFPAPSVPWTSISDVGPLLIAAVGITLVSLTDTIATATSFAAPPRGRSRSGPGDDRLGGGEPRGRVLPRVLGVDERVTDCGRGAVGGEEPTHRRGRRRARGRLVVVPELAAGGSASDRARGGGDHRGVVIDELQGAVRYFQVRPSSVALSLVATGGVVLFGVLEGIVVAIALSILMFFRRNWWPHGVVLGQVDGIDGWHSIEDYPVARERPGVVVYRWEAPLFFANAGAFRTQIRRIVRERRPSGSSAVRSDHRHRRHRRRHARVARRGAQCQRHPPRVRRDASRLQDLTSSYGLDATLDRDHFYPTLDEALAQIPTPDTDDGDRDRERRTVHDGSSVPACSAIMYAAYHSGHSSSRTPVRASCSPWAASARSRSPGRRRS